MAFLGVLMGICEVSESCDGDGDCHNGKGAKKVAVNANDISVVITKGTDVTDPVVAD